GPGNASRNHAREILIGRCAAESPAAKIDAAHAVSIRAMTRRALRGVQLRSVRDVGLRVLGRLDHSRHGSPEHEQGYHGIVRFENFRPISAAFSLAGPTITPSLIMSTT